MVAGSHLWQTIFISFALVLIAFEIVRGWRLGLVRQLLRLFAIAAAYVAGIFGGRMLLPILRPLLRIPDLIISILAGAVLALVVYAVITAIGVVLFKKTGDQGSGIVRLIYGLSGALLGVFFGLFAVWLIVVGVRSVGAVASAEVQHGVARPPRNVTSVHAENPPNEPAPPIVTSLAKLKNSIELGSLGEIVRRTDVVPATTYSALGKLGAVVSDPRSAERFLSYRGSAELAHNPKIAALRDDPEIIDLIEHQRFLELLQNPKLVAAMNDPALAQEVHHFDLQKALDYALARKLTAR